MTRRGTKKVREPELPEGQVTDIPLPSGALVSAPDPAPAMTAAELEGWIHAGMDGVSFEGVVAGLAECEAVYQFLRARGRPDGWLLEVRCRRSGTTGVIVEVRAGRSRAEVLFPCAVEPLPAWRGAR